MDKVKVTVSAASALLIAGLLLPWWSQTCDDGCTDGQTGLIDVTVAGTWRGELALGLLAAALLALLIRTGLSLVLLAGAAAVTASMLIARPHYLNAAPYYFDHHAGWHLTIAGLGLAILAVALTAIRSRTPQVADSPA